MTTEDKLEKIKKLADDMYYAAANLGPNVGSGERLRKTMEEYYKFIIHEYHKEELVSKELTDEIKLWLKQWSENEMEWSREDIWDTAEHFANWHKQQMMANAVDVTITGIREYKEENEVDFTLMLEKGTIPYKLEEDIKVIIIKD